jgi:LmbE family N-acetylglucosaminyl deacetylase
MQKILVIAAHPDDEILGCGSTLRKHILVGDEVYCLILGQGIASRMQKYIQGDVLSISQFTYSQELGGLQKDAKAAAEIIGFKQSELLSNPDNAFDTVSLLSITKSIEFYLGLWKPEIIYTHHQDLNIDHKLTFQAVMTACRPGCSTVKEIYCFETPSSTEWAFDGSFKPNVFVDITKTIDSKLKAISCYKTELRKPPHPRSLLRLISRAQYWGQVSGTDLAEAFELIRKIN